MSGASVTIRRAGAGDEAAVRQLAALDSTRPPAGETIVAEVEGEIVAALPLAGGPPVADPFVCCTELLDLLRLRAAQMDAPAAHGTRGRRVARLREWPRSPSSRARPPRSTGPG